MSRYFYNSRVDQTNSLTIFSVLQEKGEVAEQEKFKALPNVFAFYQFVENVYLARNSFNRKVKNYHQLLWINLLYLLSSKKYLEIL